MGAHRAARAAYAKEAIRDALINHKEYIYEHGEDAPDISGWSWEHKQHAGHMDSTEATISTREWEHLFAIDTLTNLAARIESRMILGNSSLLVQSVYNFREF